MSRCVCVKVCELHKCACREDRKLAMKLNMQVPFVEVPYICPVECKHRVDMILTKSEKK